MLIVQNLPKANAQTALDTYNIVWRSESKNSSGSMPCGGGDIGLNVWVENGDVMMYMSRSGAFDENNMFPKFGRLRIRLSPNPFASNCLFKQELQLKQGCVTITGTNGKQQTTVNIWVDVFRPAIHADIQSNIPVKAIASYESWRTKDRIYLPAEQAATSYKWMQKIQVICHKDVIDFSNNGVLFYHRNEDKTIFDYTVHEQGLDSVKASLWNPLHHLTYGGYLQGSDMFAAGTDTGTYVNTFFTAWYLKSKKAKKNIAVSAVLYIDTTDTINEWKQGLQAMVQQVKHAKEKAQEASKNWWQNYFNRSYIYINTDKPDTASAVWQVGRNYQLFRYMLGCNAYGSYPTKFNGGLFTYDPVFINPEYPFTPRFQIVGRRHFHGAKSTAGVLANAEEWRY